jgi:hypothetical protein
MNCKRHSIRFERVSWRHGAAAPFGLALAVFAVLALAVPSQGWELWTSNGSDNCVTCHGNFRSNSYISLVDGMNWGNLHNLHRQDMLGGDCAACHQDGSTSPVFTGDSAGGAGLMSIGCVGCHGREEDNVVANPDFPDGRAAGLRQRHFRAGALVCMNCHPDANPVNYTPVGENVLPEYYANPGTGHPAMPTDPCNDDGSENFAGATIGLDNDGDGDWDGDDGDCGATAVPYPSAFPGLLVQNTPNPFALETEIRYATRGPSSVRLEVFTVAGRLVRVLAEHNDPEARNHQVRWDGRDGQGQALASGVYLYRLTVNGVATSRTMTLLK